LSRELQWFQSVCDETFNAERFIHALLLNSCPLPGSAAAAAAAAAVIKALTHAQRSEIHQNRNKTAYFVALLYTRIAAMKRKFSASSWKLA